MFVCFVLPIYEKPTNYSVKFFVIFVLREREREREREGASELAGIFRDIERRKKIYSSII